jgi:hypothetical protein
MILGVILKRMCGFFYHEQRRHKKRFSNGENENLK